MRLSVEMFHDSHAYTLVMVVVYVCMCMCMWMCVCVHVCMCVYVYVCGYGRHCSGEGRFEGVTSAREAYTGAVGERARAVVRGSEWREGDENAKLSVCLAERYRCMWGLRGTMRWLSPRELYDG